jgi:hypothetical protein
MELPRDFSTVSETPPIRLENQVGKTAWGIGDRSHFLLISAVFAISCSDSDTEKDIYTALS